MFGWYIVEFEGGGLPRHELYGKELVTRLSGWLTASGIKGCSRTNLRKFRRFYQAFSDIRQTLSVESIAPDTISATSLRILSSSGQIPQTLSEELAKRFTLGWSHYVALVFYNRLLRCYVLIDLKLGKLSH